MIQTDYGREGVHSEHLYARGPSRTSSGLICRTLKVRVATSTYQIHPYGKSWIREKTCV